MPSPIFTHEELTQYYTTATDALCAVARAYFFLGRLSEARHLLHTTLQLKAGEIELQQRLKLLFQYGQILVTDHLLTRGDAEPLVSIVQQTNQIAEATQDQQGIADALSLLGQAHYVTTVVASLKSGISPDGTQEQGKYVEALSYQQQALKLREELHDTRGISESYFQIGVVHERWQQYEQALAFYTQARQVADQYNHPFEKTEPARHFALHAFRRQENLDQALILALQALRLREEAGFRPYQPLDHLLIRDIYLEKGDTANAEQHLRKAATLASEMEMNTLVSSMPNIRAILKSK